MSDEKVLKCKSVNHFTSDISHVVLPLASSLGGWAVVVPQLMTSCQEEEMLMYPIPLTRVLKLSMVVRTLFAGSRICSINKHLIPCDSIFLHEPTSLCGQWGWW